MGSDIATRISVSPPSVRCVDQEFPRTRRVLHTPALRKDRKFWLSACLLPPNEAIPGLPIVLGCLNRASRRVFLSTLVKLARPLSVQITRRNVKRRLICF